MPFIRLLMTIQILIDSPDSWIVPYAQSLVNELNNNNGKALL